MKPERRFKVGDKVIFKSLNEVGGHYYFGGSDQGGKVGEVVSLWDDEIISNSWKIDVEFFDEEYMSTSIYSMLESEIIEFDNITFTPFKTKTKLSFGY